MIKSTKRFVITDESVNFYGFKVRTSGIDWNRFNENPVCTLNHNYEKILGRWTDFEFNGTVVTAVPEFDEDDAEAMKIYNKVEKGIIKTASIGLNPKSKIKDLWLEQSETLEIAIAPVPGNKNAKVQLYTSDGDKLNTKATETLLLSITEISKKQNPLNMNPNVLAALVSLSVACGNTIQLNADTTDEALIAALNGATNKVTALNLSVTNLTTANEAFKNAETAAKEIEKTTALNLAVSEKRITEAQRETFSKLWDADPKLAKDTIATLAPVNLTAIPGAAAAQADDAESKYTFDEYMEKAPLKLSAMQTANPDQFNALYAAKVAAMKAAGAIE